MKILDCKYCGYSSQVALIINGRKNEVYCVSCKQGVIRQSKRKAIEAWNEKQGKPE